MRPVRFEVTPAQLSEQLCPFCEKRYCYIQQSSGTVSKRCAPCEADDVFDWEMELYWSKD
jgi:hypothetical protein